MRKRAELPHPIPNPPGRVKATARECVSLMEKNGLTITECTWVQNEIRRILKQNRKMQPLIVQVEIEHKESNKRNAEMLER